MGGHGVLLNNLRVAARILIRHRIQSAINIAYDLNRDSESLQRRAERVLRWMPQTAIP